MQHAENAFPVLKVFNTLAVRAPFANGILTGYPHIQRLSFEWSPTSVIEKKLAEGQHADLVIATDEAIANMVKQGWVSQENVFPLVTAYIGVAVPKGHPCPDISSKDAFFRALQQARSVAYSLSGASGIYLQKLMAEHGILEPVEQKATRIQQGFTGEKLLSGEADLAVQQMSELMSVFGITIVGPFPAELQQETPFTVAMMNTCTDKPQVLDFIHYLLSAPCRELYSNNGLKCR